MIAFVISRGASLGAAQAGAREALQEREVVPDVLVGSSIRAGHGAFLAADLTVGRAQELSHLSGPAEVTRDLTRVAPLLDEALHQTRPFLAGRPCDTGAHESSGPSDNAPVKEVVRLSAMTF